MSTYLWKYYLEDDVDNFRQLLANANHNTPGHTRSTGGNNGPATGSPGKGLAVSPTSFNKSRKTSATGTGQAGVKAQRLFSNVNLTRGDINSKDSHGVTVLHKISSSVADLASVYALALLDIPLLDLYIQDLESGWTALHRALYHGNITIARALMDRDSQDAISYGKTAGYRVAGGLIKIKDREGNSPFDVYGASITNRILHHGAGTPLLNAGLEEDDNEIAQGDNGDRSEDGSGSKNLAAKVCINGDELFAFGSNKNLTLGFGDEDDRQYPEKITLKRPQHLLRRLEAEHLSQANIALRTASPGNEGYRSPETNSLPALVQFRPIVIQDVQLSKLHTAVLTTDPEANLYVCGFGPGGRLGTGDETTRFHFTCIHNGGLLGKKVISIGLGQNHSIAVSSEGEVYTWGSNRFGQLGYSVPSSNLKDEESVQLLPRQIFGPLKREIVTGAAASRIHSVVHTNISLYTFGKNDGQLGLVDSDARSLEFQATPRKVAASLFSSSISMVSAIEKATVCLLDNHEVWIFANYGYTKMSFLLDGFSNYFLKNSYSTTRYDNTPNHISKITSGGDTICAMARTGDVFTVTVSQKSESAPLTTSTTNPSKIKGALSAPQCIWSLRKDHMAVRDVDVGQDGSIIICTESGSVWKRVKRAKIKDAVSSAGNVEYKSKDYKFSRISGLTRITAVRSNAFGAFAAVRRDCDVLRTQVEVSSMTLWDNLFPLLPFKSLSVVEDSDTEEPAPRFWTPRIKANDPATIRKAVLMSPNLEDALTIMLMSHGQTESSSTNLKIRTTASDASIPCHEFMLAARSPVIRQALKQFRASYFFSIPEILTMEYAKDGSTLVSFQGLDFLTVMNLVLYIYTDSVIDVWHHTRHQPKSASRYRQVRTELMRVAGHLELRDLEHAARIMVEPAKTMHQDIERAVLEPQFFETGDLDIELKGGTIKVHSALMCQRCPFFEGLFNGRAAGRWLATRRELLQEPEEAIKIDLQHVDISVFDLVLRHVYADTGEELFDNVICADQDAFLDRILYVMAVANELMLDRLAQICQKVLGRFVTTRNVCQLLNVVAPCSVTEFKDAALEYICLNLEGMLENNLLNELDDDIMLELDQVVRQNQLACLPFAKSGRAEADLLERHPELLDIMEKTKRAKIDSMALQSRLHEDEARFAKSRAPPSGEFKGSPISQAIGQSSSQENTVPSKSPLLKARGSVHDLMFQMDDEDGKSFSGDTFHNSKSDSSKGKEREAYQLNLPKTPQSSIPHEDVWFDLKGKAIAPILGDLGYSSGGLSISNKSDSGQDLSAVTTVKSLPSSDALPWGSIALTTPKLDMKDIIAQASANQSSTLTSAFSQSAIAKAESRAGVKVSQKDRKKQIQQQQLLRGSIPPSPKSVPQVSTPPSTPTSSPWQVASTGPKVLLKDVLHDTVEHLPNSLPEKERKPSNPQLTMRQTLPGNATSRKSSAPQISTPRTTQQRSISSPILTKPSQPSSSSRPSSQLPHQSNQQQQSPSSVSVPSPPVIKSIRHTPLPVEPTLQLSMADILAQQQTEKDIIKEASAKKSLQDIQEEQAFNEWWDQESRKVMLEEEAASKAREGGVATTSGRGTRGGRGRGGKVRSAGGRGRGRGKSSRDGTQGGDNHSTPADGAVSGNRAVRDQAGEKLR